MKRIISILTVAIIAFFASETVMAKNMPTPPTPLWKGSDFGVEAQIFPGRNIKIKNYNNFSVRVDLSFDAVLGWNGSTAHYKEAYEFSPNHSFNTEWYDRKSVSNVKLVVTKLSRDVKGFKKVE